MEPSGACLIAFCNAGSSFSFTCASLTLTVWEALAFFQLASPGAVAVIEASPRPVNVNLLPETCAALVLLDV